MADDSIDAVAAEADESPELWREAITMALYISLSLLAVMAALPQQQVEDASNLALTVALTSIGLILAHQLAFRLSTRLVTEGSLLDELSHRLLRMQLAGGAVVTIVAVVPILLFGTNGYRVAMGLLLLFVMAVGYFVARTRPASRLRSLIYVLGVGAAVILILVVKGLVTH